MTTEIEEHARITDKLIHKYIGDVLKLAREEKEILEECERRCQEKRLAVAKIIHDLHSFKQRILELYPDSTMHGTIRNAEYVWAEEEKRKAIQCQNTTQN